MQTYTENSSSFSHIIDTRVNQKNPQSDTVENTDEHPDKHSQTDKHTKEIKNISYLIGKKSRQKVTKILATD